MSTKQYISDRFVIFGGTGMQFLKADGTLDNNVYATEAEVAAITHDPVTLGTANGLTIAGQVLSLTLASSGVTGALLGSDWVRFNNKQDTLVSAVNIKTIEGRNILGAGDINLNKDDVGLDQVDNTSDADKPISAATQAVLNLKANDSDVVHRTTPETISGLKTYTVLPQSNVTPVANFDFVTKAYADSLVVGLVDDRGNWDASTGVWPSSGGSGAGGSIMKGDLWYVNVPGTIGTTTFKIGDSFRALVDLPGQTDTNWDSMESNLGYVPANSTTSLTVNGPLWGSTTLAGPINIGINMSQASVDGYLSGADWIRFNSKTDNIGTVTEVTAATDSVGTDVGATVTDPTGAPHITIHLPSASSNTRGVLTSADWITFNSKVSAPANTVTGIGTVDRLAKWTGPNTQGDSNLIDSGSYMTSTVPFAVQGPIYTSGSIQIGDDNVAPSAANIGTMRYKSDATNSFVDMVMQTGAGTYAWINIVQRNW